MHTTTRQFFTIALVTAFAVCNQGVQASTIAIDFSGLDITFDGTDITNAGSPASDSLDSTTVTVDGSVTAFGAGDVSIDFLIPDVDPIPTAGGIVSAGDTGSVTLSFPSSDSLSVELGPSTVNFLDIGGGVTQLVFSTTGADAGSVIQSLGGVLPPGVLVGDPITFSFAAVVDSGTLLSDAGVVTGFSATGAGSVDGLAVPEPAAFALGLIAMTGVAIRRRR